MELAREDNLPIKCGKAHSNFGQLRSFKVRIIYEVKLQNKNETNKKRQQGVQCKKGTLINGRHL